MLNKDYHRMHIDTFNCIYNILSFHIFLFFLFLCCLVKFLFILFCLFCYLLFTARRRTVHSPYLLRRRGWVAGWLAGCLSVARRYCIKTAKSILKLLRPSGSHIILVSSDPCADTKFQGKPLQRRR